MDDISHNEPSTSKIDVGLTLEEARKRLKECARAPRVASLIHLYQAEPPEAPVYVEDPGELP
jgi:hypothetical protein